MAKKSYIAPKRCHWPSKIISKYSSFEIIFRHPLELGITFDYLQQQYLSELFEKMMDSLIVSEHLKVIYEVWPP
jgi:hypothetical protein